MKTFLFRVVSLLVIATVITTMGCTEKQRARQFGGKSKTDVARCQKLTVVTWKEDSLWTLTRPARPGESAETYTFSEDSSFGLMEGKATIIEHIDESCFKK
jgi:hypothetical protein